MTRLRRTLVIAGMHRSGTSLLASLAREAGIDMGADLLPAGRGNPRGHFEDLEFVRFHDRCLERRGASPLSPAGEGSAAAFAADELRLARAILERRSGKQVWGWKDPRTSLFLPAWHDLLGRGEEPFYLLVYRHPVAVALSLLRRGMDLEVQLDPAAAMRAWTIYNQELLAFRLAWPERCLLLPIAGVAGNLEAAMGLIAGRSGLPLGGPRLAEIYAPDQLQHRLLALDIDWRAVLPHEMSLYDRLEAAADLAPGAPAGPAAEGVETAGPQASVRERGLQEAAEHLLAVALGSRSGAAAAGHRARIDYSRLKLLIAHQEELIARLDVDRTRVAARLAAREQDQRRVEATRAWRLIHSYWRGALRLRRWTRQAGWRLRPTAPPPPEEIVVGCVSESDPASLSKALLLVRSLRCFGGSLAGVRIVVCVVGAPGADKAGGAGRTGGLPERDAFERLGVALRTVPRFDRRNPSANKLQWFDEALASGARGLLLLDHDIAVVGDPFPLLAGDAFQAKIGDVASVTHATFVRLFRHFGLPLPARRYRTTLLAEPTILYCNSGVVFLTSELAREFVPVWREWNLRILDVLDLLGPEAHHCHQASLSLALAAHPIPFAEAPAALNFPLHLRGLPRSPTLLAAEPVLLHYHNELDTRGRLLPVAWPKAQARIESLNRRLAPSADGAEGAEEDEVARLEQQEPVSFSRPTPA